MPGEVEYCLQQTLSVNFCTPSRRLMSFLVCGSHTAQTYSRWGRTREMYNCCNECEFEWAANVLKRYPIRRRAFEHMLCICADQMRVEFNKTPKYLNSSTCSRGWPSRWRLSSGTERILLCEMTIALHLEIFRDSLFSPI